MREQFRAYYSPSSEEFGRLWDEALIVFDANALLNLFRYSATVRDEWLELLQREENRLWLPHQAGLEFHRNRRMIASQQAQAFDQVEKALTDAEANIRKSIDGLRRHPSVEAEESTALIERHMRKVQKKFKKARARHFDAVLNQEAHDNTLESITSLYEGKVGDAYSKERFAELVKEGAARYARKIPPGYMDDSKEGDRKYGDFILWRQMLDHGEKVKKPVIFVTDDAKEDWWLKAGSKTLGPRPELVEEYFEAADERIHLYEPRAFLRFARERGEEISETAIAEAKSVSNVKFNISYEALRQLQETIARLNSAQLGDSVRGNMAPSLSGIAEAMRTIDNARLAANITEGLRRSDLFSATDYLRATAGRDALQGLRGLGESASLYDKSMAAMLAARRAQRELDEQRALGTDGADEDSSEGEPNAEG